MESGLLAALRGYGIGSPRAVGCSPFGSGNYVRRLVVEESSRGIERANADTFASDRFVQDYNAFQGWNDPGEMRTLLSIAAG